MDPFPSFSEIPRMVIWDRSLLCLLCMILLWFLPVPKNIKLGVYVVLVLGCVMVSYVSLYLTWGTVFFPQK